MLQQRQWKWIRNLPALVLWNRKKRLHSPSDIHIKIKHSNRNESSTGMQHSVDKDNTWGQVGGWMGWKQQPWWRPVFLPQSCCSYDGGEAEGGEESLCTLLWAHGSASMLPKISVRRISGSAPAAGRDLLLQGVWQWGAPQHCPDQSKEERVDCPVTHWPCCLGQQWKTKQWIVANCQSLGV